MPRNNPLPTVHSEWGKQWQDAWVLLGSMDGRRDAMRRGGNAEWPTWRQSNPHAWQRLWTHMFFNVLNVDGYIDGWSPDFARDCYIMWLYGYNSHARHIDELVRDASLAEKTELIQELWYRFQEEEPPEIDRWWL